MHAAAIIQKPFILPVIDYRGTVWNCCNCGHMDADNIEKLQRREARIIMLTDSSGDVLGHLKYDTLGLRRKIHVLNLVKKCLNKYCPQFLMDYFLL